VKLTKISTIKMYVLLQISYAIFTTFCHVQRKDASMTYNVQFACYNDKGKFDPL
jgi:hypothetical protein